MARTHKKSLDNKLCNRPCFGGCGNTLDDFGEVLLFSFLSLTRLKSILMAFIFVRQQMHQMADDSRVTFN